MTAAKKNPAETPRIVLSDGSAASIDGARLTVEGPGGELRVLYEEGKVTLFVDAAEVVLKARGQATLEAPRGLTLRSAEHIAIDAPRIDAKSQEATWTSGRLELAIGVLETAAHRTRVVAEEVETVCGELYERSREVLRETSGLVEERAGRLRVLVTDAYRLIAKRGSIESEEDTKIDGKRVLLG